MYLVIIKYNIVSLEPLGWHYEYICAIYIDYDGKKLHFFENSSMILSLQYAFYVENIFQSMYTSAITCWLRHSKVIYNSADNILFNIITSLSFLD